MMTQFGVFKKAGRLVAVLAIAALAAATTAEAAPAEGDMALGPADSKVTIIEYASMTCPHCANFHNNTFKKLKEKYIDTGKVRFIFREFPLDRVAFMASMLARCAGPDRFFGMIDVMFRSQEKWGRSEDPRAELIKIGRLAGMPKETIEACFTDQKLGDAILATRMEGHKKYEISSTPSFVVNGETFTGALSIEKWDEIIAGKSN
jgi:protein-disulfide isomerase